MKVVIMAGGKGTRLKNVSDNLPKPMVPLNGVPILETEINILKNQGFDDFIITVGYKADKIIDYFGNGEKFNVNINYYKELEPLGNAGALFKLDLKDDFILINGDIVFNVDINRMVKYHKEKGGLVTLLTHPNSHPFDSGILITDSNKSVLQWLTKEDKRPNYYKNRVNAGIHIISPKIFDIYYMNKNNVFENDSVVDLDRQLLKPLCGTSLMYCYDTPEYVKDMGTPERMKQVESDLIKGIVNAKNLKNKQKAIFLDRDGTINHYVGFVRKAKELELANKSAQAIKKINESGYLAIVITNQPVIARGETTLNELENIHNKMETLLGEEGAYVDAIYYCPHHPDKGYFGEILDLKIDCECRKPKPGLLLKAIKDFNIDIHESYMIGDSDSDVKAGINAGCKAFKINEGELMEVVSNILLNDNI